MKLVDDPDGLKVNMGVPQDGDLTSDYGRNRAFSCCPFVAR